MISSEDKELLISIEKYQQETAKSRFKTTEEVELLLTADRFEEFVYYFWGDQFDDMKPMGYFHKEAIENMFIHGKRQQIWEWFRGSGKSMMASLYLPTFLFLIKQFRGMIVIGNSESAAKQHMHTFVTGFFGNTKIHNFLGSVPERAGQLSKLKMSINDKFGIFGFGMGQSPQGSKVYNNRPNYLLMDDVEKASTAREKETHAEGVRFLMGTVMGCLMSTSNIPNYVIFANNRLKGVGLMSAMVDYNKEQSKPPFHHSIVYLTEDPKKKHSMLLLEQGGHSAWKEAYTDQNCQDTIDAMGKKQSLRQNYHQDVSDATFFDIDNIAYTPMEIPVQNEAGERVIQKYIFSEIIIYTDPAFSNSKKADYSAIVVLGHDKNKNKVVLIDINISKDPFERSIFRTEMRIMTYMENYYTGTNHRPVYKRFIEAVGSNEASIYQRFQSFQEKESSFVPPAIDKKQKHAKEERIQQLPYYLEKGILVFNEDIKKTSKHSYELLLEEMNMFPDGVYDDGLDALHGAFSCLKLFKGNYTGMTIDISKFMDKPRPDEDIDSLF